MAKAAVQIATEQVEEKEVKEALKNLIANIQLQKKTGSAEFKGLFDEKIKALANYEKDWEGLISDLLQQAPVGNKDLVNKISELHVKLPQVKHELDEGRPETAINILEGMLVTVSSIGKGFRKRAYRPSLV